MNIIAINLMKMAICVFTIIVIVAGTAFFCSCFPDRPLETERGSVGKAGQVRGDSDSFDSSPHLLMKIAYMIEAKKSNSYQILVQDAEASLGKHKEWQTRAIAEINSLQVLLHVILS